MQVGTLLKEARLAANHTQESASLAYGISNRMLSRYENNVQVPSAIKFIELMKMYGCNLQISNASSTLNLEV